VTGAIDGKKRLSVVRLTQWKQIASHTVAKPVESIFFTDRQLWVQIESPPSAFETGSMAFYVNSAELLQRTLGSRRHSKRLWLIEFSAPL